MSCPVQLILTGRRGCIARAMVAWMKANQPEVDIVYLHPFPFCASALQSLLASGNVRYMVNCAALGDDAASVDDPFTYYETNCFGVTKQLEVIRRHSPSTRYINLGSIYESKGSPYAGSKRCARDVIKTYREQYGLYALQGTLGFTEYPGRAESRLSRRITKGVARITRAIKDGQPFEPLVLRDLDQHYSWTWAEDVADGLWRMLNQVAYPESKPESATEIEHTDGWLQRGWRPQEYILSTEETHTVRAFVEKAFAAAGIVELQTAQGSQGNQQVCLRWRGNGVDEAYELGGMVTHVSDSGWDASWGYAKSLVRSRPTLSSSLDITHLHGDATRARTELGWTPKVSFDQLVEEMVRADLKAVGL